MTGAEFIPGAVEGLHLERLPQSPDFAVVTLSAFLRELGNRMGVIQKP
jgi:hypothetical protein